MALHTDDSRMSESRAFRQHAGLGARAATGGEPAPKRTRKGAFLKMLEAEGEEAEEFAMECSRITQGIAVALLLDKKNSRTGKANCRLCTSAFVVTSDGCEANVVTHMKSRHPALWQEVEERRQDINRSSEKDSRYNRMIGVVRELIVPDRQTILPFVRLRNPGKVLRSIYLATACFLKGLPLRNYDDPTLRATFIAFSGCGCTGGAACERCSYHCSTWVRETLVPHYTVAVLEQLRDNCKDIMQISLTADGWSSRAMEKFLAVTGHYLTKDFKARTILIGIEHLDFNRGDAEGLRSSILRIVSQFNPAFDAASTFIASITVDNERAMTNAASEVMGEGEEDRCLAHTLQLCLSGAEKALPDLSRLLAKIRSLCATLKNTKARNIVRRYCLFLKAGEAILPCPTRWCSNFYMVERFNDLIPGIEKAVINGNLEEYGGEDTWLLSVEEKSLLQAFLFVLEPFEKVTRLAEGDSYVSIAHIPTWLVTLQTVCNPCTVDSQSMGLLKGALREEMQSRLSQYWQVEKPANMDPIVAPCLCAAALHPGLWDLPMLTETERGIVADRLILDAAQFEDDHKRVNVPNHYRDLVLDMNKFDSLDTTQTLLREGGQLTPAMFWASPDMSPPKEFVALARMLLAIPATSASSERVFSAASFWDERSKGACNASTLASLTFLRNNIRHLLSMGFTADQLAEKVLAGIQATCAPEQ